MGFFSWQCKVCDESIKAPYDIPKSMAFQNECVVIEHVNYASKVFIGEYDGYGRVGDDLWDWSAAEKEPIMYHKKCWEKAGKPLGDLTPSRYAPDQGFFYEEGPLG